MQAYTKFIRPFLYTLLITFNLYAFITNDPKVIFAGNRYINLFFVALFSAMLFLNYWLQNKIKK